MNIYIDESGSINNHCSNNKYFIVAMIHVLDKKGLERAYRRFVSSNYSKLRELDCEKRAYKSGKILKSGNKMFSNGRFKELKGAQFDKEMKLKFMKFFSKKHYFDIYYIRVSNYKLSDTFCSNTARVFNYIVRLALEYFYKKKYLPYETCNLQLDERNEKTETKYFLESYLNTELSLNNESMREFSVTYFDSANNKFIQIADVFANIYYSHLQTAQYEEEFAELKKQGMVRCIFQFPI